MDAAKGYQTRGGHLTEQHSLNAAHVIAPTPSNFYEVSLWYSCAHPNNRMKFKASFAIEYWIRIHMSHFRRVQRLYFGFGLISSRFNRIYVRICVAQ